VIVAPLPGRGIEELGSKEKPCKNGNFRRFKD
jgi:hypothetical protein